jgi:uncharacterized protein YbjQ (UPF0145 family)
MSPRGLLGGVAILAALNGCSTTSGSTAIAPIAQAWNGPILVTTAQLPAGMAHTVVGTVQADARAGYDKAETLYGFLASEARKLGGNAVVGTTGGRKMTAMSWSAAYVRGTAVRVEDPEKLRGLPGSYHQ